jgi:threonine dehydrogenase-like Zn-dependent dehydrogenase
MQVLRASGVKAVVKARAAFGIDVQEVTAPEIGADEVLVRVEAAGICGSDVHIYEWTPGYEFLTRHLPVVLGHEFAGVVEAIGRDVGVAASIGDRVTSETSRVCGQCTFCRRGQAVLCTRRTAEGRLGLERRGAMTRLAVVPAQCLHRVPDGVSLEAAAVSEPAAVALGAVRMGSLEPGDPLVILGPGPIGLLALQLARAAGAGPVIVVGHSSDGQRLETARRLGAAETLAGDPSSVLARVMALTDGVGVPAAIDASGAVSAATLALAMVRKGGRLVLAGIYPDVLPIDATRQVVRQMKSIHGAYGGASLDFDRVLALMADGRLDVRPLVSELPLSDAVHGFELLRRKQAFKVLLRPGA